MNKVRYASGQRVEALPRSWRTLEDSTGHEGDDVSDQGASALLQDLERRAFKTYQARVRATARLAARNRAWNAFLIATSSSGVIASVALLVEPDIYGVGGPVLLVVVSMLTVVASLVTASLDYSGRARNMFINYRKVQRLSGEAERAQRDPGQCNFETAQRLFSQYDGLLDESENHTAGDYARAQSEWRSGSRAKEMLLTFAPLASLSIPILLLVPFLGWIWRNLP